MNAIRSAIRFNWNQQREREKKNRAFCFPCQLCHNIPCFVHFLSYIKVIKVNFSICCFFFRSCVGLTSTPKISKAVANNIDAILRHSAIWFFGVFISHCNLTNCRLNLFTTWSFMTTASRVWHIILCMMKRHLNRVFKIQNIRFDGDESYLFCFYFQVIDLIA